LEQQHKMQDLAKAEFTKWWRANPNATEEEVCSELRPSSALAGPSAQARGPLVWPSTAG